MREGDDENVMVSVKEMVSVRVMVNVRVMVMVSVRVSVRVTVREKLSEGLSCDSPVISSHRACTQ